MERILSPLFLLAFFLGMLLVAIFFLPVTKPDRVGNPFLGRAIPSTDAPPDCRAGAIEDIMITRNDRTRVLSVRVPEGRQVNYFLGDSIVAGGDWSRRFSGHCIVNAGHPGDTIEDIIRRAGDITAGRSDTIFLMAGINNFAAGQSAEEIAVSYTRLLGTVSSRSPGSRLIVMSTLPVNHTKCNAVYGPACSEYIDNLRIAELNGNLSAAAGSLPRAEYLDLCPLLTDKTELAGEYTSDGIHLTPRGYKRWEQAIRDLLV